MKQIIRAALSLLALIWPTGANPQEARVDLALVLAIDCSFSVDRSEFVLQMKGIGEAIQNPAVIEAILKGPHQKIAVAAVQWSDSDNQVTVLPWMTIASENDAREAGAKLITMSRRLAEGGTSIGNALVYSSSLFETAPAALRNVIDLSTDGRNNTGPALPPIRNAVVAAGMTINALVITNEVETLDKYAERQIVGGAGNFVIKANSYSDYGKAMVHKLIKEVVGPGIT